uniref:Uncharacterized protein n=1 Tax=Mycena chlorophos TaxID=658473 RepID=A0ABQ0LZT2_MYCCL|nr:predicted protein [Mycena chlorophos]
MSQGSQDEENLGQRLRRARIHCVRRIKRRGQHGCWSPMLSCRPLLPLDAPVAPRPRGLWKGRGRKRQSCDWDNLNQRPAKRHRSEETSDDEDSYYLVEITPEPSPQMETEDECFDEQVETVEDWEDLKTAFASAAEQYENDNAAETIQLLRGVLKLCHRFLLLYQDPSVLYAQPRPKSPESPAFPSISPRLRKKCKCRETPTAFHSILGTTLFLFGNILAQDPSLVLPDEPSTPVTYYLNALDVFEMGDALPSRTSGRGCEAPEDWRMNVVWGRVLLCVADAAMAQQRTNTHAPPEPKWPSPEASVFAAIKMRRSPGSRPISLDSAIPHELLLVAMDHFARGIFLMPHNNVPSTTAPSPSKTSLPPFSRAAELFTIALEVLAVAERLPSASERMRWASWADTVLGQIPTQAQTALVACVRGRCWLIYGSANAEAIEDAGEAKGWDMEDAEIFDSEDAQDARDGLERAIGFFERAISDGGESEDELQAFLAEALLTLANVTKDEGTREELYKRAQSLGCVALDAMEC